MKKVYVLLAVLFLSAAVSAQVVTNQKMSVNQNNLKLFNDNYHSTAKVVNDTMGLNEYVLVLATDQFYFDALNFFSSGEPMGGFVASPDLLIPSTFSAEGILWRVFDKHAQSGSPANSMIYLRSGYYDINTDSSMIMMTEDSITFAQVDTTTANGGWNTKLFATPVLFEDIQRPWVMVDFAKSSDVGDTIFGLLFDGPFIDMDCAAQAKVGGVWSWYYLSVPCYFEAWIIADNQTGIAGSDNFFAGMQLSQNYPNPAVNGTTTIEYGFNHDVKSATLDIIDMNGKVVETISLGSKTTGLYTITLNNHLTTGTYFYSLVADGMRFTKRMVIE